MNTLIRNFLICIAILSLVTVVTACGSKDAGETNSGGEEPASTTSGSPAAIPDGETPEPTVQTGANVDEKTDAASFQKAFKAMAASEGIYFGEVPEGFPLDFLPLYPGGEIDKSQIDEEGATLLQVVPADQDTVFAYYREFYAKLGMNSGNPITVAGRTMASFTGGGGKIDMTMIDREEGKTFVALAMH